jgi:hypothetical protein
VPMQIGADLESAVQQATDMGPAKRALTDQPEELRARAIDSVRRTFAPHMTPAGLSLPGAVWLVGAENAA